jgi:Fur family ferric uptake transcriptional regulator
MDEIEVFRNYIKESGLRNTPEREVIIKEVFSTHDHFDVDTLYLRLKNKKKHISKASIYRTIPLLIESGLIKEVFFEDGHMHYEHVYGHEHHCHFRCLGCKRVIEFKQDEVLDIQEKFSRNHRFEVTGHRLELSGYCLDCMKKEGKN